MPPAPQRKLKPWSQPLADLVVPQLASTFAMFGFDDGSLLLLWPEIVGARLASRCEPLKLQWPPRRTLKQAQDAATLIVRVDGAFAIELQHEAPTVIERINAHVGWRCIGRLALRQGPFRTSNISRVAPRSPEAAARQEAEAVTTCIADDGLRRALVRLGARVIDARRSSP